MSPLNCSNSESSNYYENDQKRRSSAIQMGLVRFLKSNPNFRGDSIAKRCAFNDYVDSLNKDGMVTDYQEYNWSNPF